MRLDEQLDEALTRLPVWAPPARFAPRVAAAARAEVRTAPRESPVPRWVLNALYGTGMAAMAGALGAAVWWVPKYYAQIMTAAVQVVVMEPVAVSWTCAAISLVVAAISARQALA